MEWLLTLGTAAALCALFATSEIALRRGVPAETTRRFVHVVGAGTATTFPLYLQLRDVLLLAAGFSVLLTYTSLHHSLRSIHAVERRSLGAPLFPLGLGITALAVWHHPGAFGLATLVLGFADPAAAIAGNWTTGPSWKVMGGTKSVIGCLTFFVVAVGLECIFGIAFGGLHPLTILAVAAALTAIEGSLGYGLDNLFVPLTAAISGSVVLGL